MNWRYLIGELSTRSLDTVLSSKFFPLTRYVPHGLSWLYDVQRYLGTRSLGIAFDVSANRGQTLQQLLRFAPEAQIYSFEPASDTFAMLEQAFKEHSNVHLSNLAVGASAERMALQVGANSELNTLVPRQSPGAATLIANQNLLFVYAEVAFRADQKEMQQFGELHSHLESSGFSLCGIYEPLRYGPRKEFVLFANALYLNPQARLKWSTIGHEWEEWMAGEAAHRAAD